MNEGEGLAYTWTRGCFMEKMTDGYCIMLDLLVE